MNFIPDDASSPPGQVEHGSLFPSAVIALYVVFLCFSALGSQPYDYKCNGMGHDMDATKLWVGMIFTLRYARTKTSPGPPPSPPPPWNP